MHTPRLCIDARSAQAFPVCGILAQEVVDQLVAAAGEPDIGSEWIERRRVVLLSHPEQVFSGQIKRHDTRLGLHRTPWHWLRHKHFIKNAGLSAFHEISPADRCSPSAGLPTLTTLLPPRGRLPFILSRRPEHHYLVPSEKDARILESRYQIPREQITRLRPAARRYVHFTVEPQHREQGGLLLLTGGSHGATLQKKLLKVVSEAYPRLPQRVISLRKAQDVSAVSWRKILEQTRLVIYLQAPPFDWAPLALEATYWGRPTIFSDEHGALAELLPESKLRLSRFLVERPSLEELERLAQIDGERLENHGCFDAFAFARSYRDVYRKLGSGE